MRGVGGEEDCGKRDAGSKARRGLWEKGCKNGNGSLFQRVGTALRDDSVFSQKIYSEFKSVKCSPANLVGRNFTFHSAREDSGAQVDVSFQHSGKTLL